MAKKLSLLDIANELNISKTTISFILNGKAKEKRISEVLTNKVLKYLEDKDYRPNQLAKSLSTGKTMIIGLMVEKISDYFFAQIAYHIEELAYQNGYKIIYCSTDNDPDKSRELISLFRDRHVDGYIITPPSGIEKDIQALIDDNLPVVLFDRYFLTVNASYVILNNQRASYDAVKHLAGQDYRNIALVELDSDQTQMHDRREGYLQAIREHELTPLICKIPFSNDSEQSAQQLVTFIQDNPTVDAIFFATNYLAFSGIKALNLLGLKTPGDLAIIAFDDHQVFNVYAPTITAVAQPIDELARQLIQVLLKQIQSPEHPKHTEQVIVPSALILRDSTTPSRN